MTMHTDLARLFVAELRKSTMLSSDAAAIATLGSLSEDLSDFDFVLDEDRSSPTFGSARLTATLVTPKARFTIALEWDSAHGRYAALAWSKAVKRLQPMSHESQRGEDLEEEEGRTR